MEKQSSYLFLNGQRVHYLHWNLGDSGCPVVLLHGLASNARIWELVAPRLAAAGLVPLAPDARGHGLTDKPDGDYSLSVFSQDLAAFIDGCGLERPVLVGHSWGAMVALDYAARFAVGPRAPAGIVLVDGGMTQLDDGGQTWEQVRDRLTPPRLKGTPLDDFLARVNTFNPRWQPDEAAVQIILANFEVDEEEKIAPQLSFEHHMQIVRAMWEFPTMACYRRLRCPALLVPAQPAEPLSPGETEFLALKRRGIQQAMELSPSVQVRWMPDTIHDIPLQKPGELSSLMVEFAASLDEK